MDNMHILVDAKNEYTKQLTNLLIPLIYEGILSIYKNAKKSNDNQILVNFQKMLSKIPYWNQEIIEREFKRIKKKSDCEWLEDLITAVFVSHTKVLSSIRNVKIKNNVDLTIPKGTYFIHKTYIEVAREFWKTPYLYYDIDTSTCEIQRNMRECEKLIENAICETIRKLLPVKNILKEYLGDDIDEDLEDRNNLKKMIDKDINNLEKSYNKYKPDKTDDSDSIYYKSKNIKEIKIEKNNEEEISIDKSNKEENVKKLSPKNIDELKRDLKKELDSSKSRASLNFRELNNKRYIPTEKIGLIHN